MPSLACEYEPERNKSNLSISECPVKDTLLQFMSVRPRAGYAWCARMSRIRPDLPVKDAVRLSCTLI